jgi:WD40 repeat protein
MSAERKCSECGAAIPPGSTDGLCGQCLFSLGMNAQPDVPATAPAPPDLAPLLAKSTPAIGVKFHYFGDYELLEEIARGGMGIVFKARQMSLNRLVAVKLISSGTLATEELVKRFKAEAEAAASLSHPNIVPIYEIGEHQGQHYFSMGLIEGPNLRQALSQIQNPKSKTRNPSEPRQAARLVSTIARAVHYAHQRGVLHRDIKPSNILLDAKGEPHLTDFGLAKLIEKESTLTQTNAVMGTPAYMSPEQARGGTKGVTTVADVYGLGAVLYEMLTGSPPFGATTFMETIRQVLDREPRPPSIFSAATDRDLETICLKCLEKEPNRRYGSADALANELDRWLRHEPIQARPITAVERVQKWVRRRPAIAALAAGLALAFMAGLGGVTWQWRRAERERDAAQLNLYVANMNLVAPAWEQNNARRVRELLDQTAKFADRGFEWYYGQRQAHLNRKTLYGHLGAVRAVAFSPDSQRIVTSSDDGTARVWDAATGKELLILRGHTAVVNAAAFSPDGRRVVTGSNDRTARVWEAASGRELVSFRGHLNAVRGVTFSPSGRQIVTSSEDRMAKVWDVASARELLSLKGHTGGILAVAFSPDGRQIVTGSRDETARVWDAGSGVTLLSLGAHTGALRSVAFSPNGTRIVTGDDLCVRVWSVATGKEVLNRASRISDISALHSVAFSPDGEWVLSSGEDQMARLWEISGERIFMFRGHIGPVFSAAFSPDGQRVVTGSRDQTARIWEVPRHEEPLVLEGHKKIVRSVGFSPDSQRVVTCSDDWTARVWEAATGKELLLLERHAGAVRCVAISADGQRIATGSEDRTAKVWDAITGQEVVSLRGHLGQVYSVAFSPDSRRIVTGGEDRTAKVWDPATGKELFTLGKHGGTIRSVAFSPDGHRIVSGGEDGAVMIWDAKDRRKLLTIRANAGVYSLAFASDSQRIACGSRSWTVGVWDVASGKALVSLLGHNHVVHSVAFSPDGHRIITGSDDQTVKVWEAATGRELLTLKLDDRIVSVAFSPDGRRIVAGTWGGPVMVWEAASGAQVEAWRGKEQAGIEYVAAQKRGSAKDETRVSDSAR